MFVRVEVVDQSGLPIHPSDVDIVALQHLAQLVAHEVDDCLEVELGGNALLDAVDHRHLGGALLGFLEQPLRLIEQARALQRDAHRRGDRGQEAHLGFAERIFALVAFQADRAHAPVTDDDWNQRVRQALVRARCGSIPRGDQLGQRVCDDRCAQRADIGPLFVRIDDGCRKLQALAVLDYVEIRDRAPRVIDPLDGDVVALQNLAQLIADEVDDPLKIERTGHPLLDAVDDGELARALLEFGRALRDLALQTSGEAHVGERHGGLRGEHGDEVTVAVVEAAERAIDVAVDVTQELALDDQRRDQMAALLDGRDIVGRMAQADGAAAARLGQPRCHGFEQRVIVFAFRHE